MRKLHVSAVCLLSLQSCCCFVGGHVRPRSVGLCVEGLGPVHCSVWRQQLTLEPTALVLITQTCLVTRLWWSHVCVFFSTVCTNGCVYVKDIWDSHGESFGFFGFSWLSSNNRKTNLNYSWKLLSRFVLWRFLETISHKVTDKKKLSKCRCNEHYTPQRYYIWENTFLGRR